MLNDIAAENRRYVLFPWSRQKDVHPRTVVRMEGCHFWDTDGRRYLDFAAQHVCVNAGHQHPKIVAAIQAQAERLCYMAPSLATEPRGRLARMIAEVAPGDLNKVYFTSGGAEANDYAMKFARWFTGRPKVIARYSSYHGASWAALSLTGEARTAHMGPRLPGIRHTLPPYCYRCSFGQEPGTCARECLSALEEIIQFENPDFVAAVICETVTGTHLGVPVPPPDYFRRLRALCDKYGILLICDEILMGFGRTGKWFAIEHFGVVPDLMTVSKGINSATVPLAAVLVSDRIAAHFEENELWSGSTYSGHALACAAGVATLEVYREEGLIENAARLGAVMMAELKRMQAKHPCVGDVRGLGLVGVIELVHDRATREPMLPRDGIDPLAPMRKAIADGGVHTPMRGQYIAMGPPLTITEAELREGLAVIDRALDLADAAIAKPAGKVA